MGENMQTIKKILCATDLSKFSTHLIEWGVELCSRFNARLLIFHAIPPPWDSVARQIEFERGGEKEENIEASHEKIKTIMGPFDIPWDSILAYGDPVHEAAETAKTTHADMVIAASHGLTGFQQFFMGSVIGSMAQTVARPLLMIPPPETDFYTQGPKPDIKNIITACSLTSADKDLKPFALTFSEKFNSPLEMVHVMESPVNTAVVSGTSAPYDEVQKRLEEQLAQRLKLLMPGKTQILRGVPGEELMQYAKNHAVDLIIAGIDDRPGRIITTTTAALLRHLPCPVLTVPVKTDG
jgi:nucleotide-binding universal stress UspA family protein